MAQNITKLTKKDFQPSRDVKWCPGCGDYAVLATVQKTLPELNIPKENIVFISGIGCAARFPYYMKTFGMHTIHGRGATIATGLKITRPELSVWLISGDGDSFSIGTNHTIHLMRKNIDVNLLMFNNRVYGLTKGQYSPTSVVGMKAKSTPYGSVESPIDPMALAIGAGATFIARAVDVDGKNLSQIIKRAQQHKGTAFVEIYQNCLVFNDGAFANIASREHKAGRQLMLEHGKPLLFDSGKKGIGFDGASLSPKIIDLQKNPQDISQVLVHNKNDQKGILASIYTKLTYPEFPVPFGIFRAINKANLDKSIGEQIEAVRKKYPAKNLQQLLNGNEAWQH